VIIPPGKPFKNGYVESFHSRRRVLKFRAEREAKRGIW